MRSTRRKLLFVVLQLLRIRWINCFLRTLLRLSGQRLPSMVADRFPVSGDVQIPLPNERCVVLRTGGRDTIASQIYWRGLQAQEPLTIELSIRPVPTIEVVLDGGASTGTFSLIAGAANKGQSVRALEPVPETFEFLVRNIAANRLESILPVQVCVTGHDGEINIDPIQSPALPFQTSVKQGYQGHETLLEIRTAALTLDSYVASQETKRVGLIKIDAEASDHIVLQRTKEILDRDKPVIICEILYTDTDHRLEDFFRGSGYRCFRIEKDGLAPRENIAGDSEDLYRNFLFGHESRVEELMGVTSVAVAGP